MPRSFGLILFHFCIFLYFGPSRLVAQSLVQESIKDSIPSVIKHLLATPKAIPYIYSRNLNGIIPKDKIPAHFQREDQYLIKTSNQLFAGVDGSGLLYELKDSAGRLQVTRIDQSEHHGSNFGALNFTLNDTIYALGGYGFWRSNGQLRYFNPDSKQWSLIKLNQNIEMYHPLAWIDAKNNLLYCFGSFQINQGIEDTHPKKSKQAVKLLYVLNIQMGTWTLLGEMESIYDMPADKINMEEINPDGIYPSCDLNMGFFMTNQGRHHINDFKNNKRGEPTRQFNLKFTKFYKFGWNIMYFIDSTLYYANPEINAIDSIRFQQSDFIATGKKVYTPVSSGSLILNKYLREIALILSGIFGGGMVLIMIAYIRRKKKKIAESNPGKDVGTDSDLSVNKEKEKNISLFDEIETELIRFIVEKCKTGNTATVPEINRILGLADKNEAVQKKNRSEKINRINEKWMRKRAHSELLIQRRRSDFDKRNFEYYIEPSFFSEINFLQP